MVHLTGEDLTIEQVIAVAHRREEVAPLDAEVKARMKESYAWIQAALKQDGAPIYGVTTGLGSLANVRIAPEMARRLSRNLVLSSLVGVGVALPEEVVRAMMLLRANTFAKGHSGVRPELAETLISMLNAGVTPKVSAKGSLGASGDLAPLAQIAAVISIDPDDGENGYSGEAWHAGELLSGAAAMAAAGVPRLVLEAKEGLALTNGTNFMLAAASLALYEAENLMRHAVIAAALSLEASKGVSTAFDVRLHRANGQPGQLAVAQKILAITEGSKLLDSDPTRVQDAYSIRCTPQVLGPVRDLLAFLRQRATAALNGAADNPLIFLEGPGEAPAAVTGGNFHGQGPALWLDILGVALAQIGAISERRTFRLTTPELSHGLPPMLVRSSGLDSGMMMPQYTAAALVADNKVLSHPDSVDSIPSSANQEDFVSMGANAARHTLEIVDNVRHILAIELLTAAQAIDLRSSGPDKLGAGTKAAYQAIRERAAMLERDRELSPDIEALAQMIAEESILEQVEEAIEGEL